MVEVIDASVAIKWFVQEPGREAALKLLAKILATPQHYCVPELFFFELANIFNRLLPQASVEQKSLFENLFDLGLTRFSLTAELFRELRYFQSLGLSGYDASYVALAKSVEGQWVTFDAKAHKKIATLKLSRLLQ